MAQLGSASENASEIESVEESFTGVEMWSRLKQNESRLRRQRNHARERCKHLEQKLEELRSHLTELEADGERGRTDSDNVGEDSSDYEEEEMEPVVPRRRVQKNVAQQSALLSAFNGDEAADGTTIQDWLNEFDALATVYQWSSQEKLVALVSKLKGAALSVYHTASDKEKRSFSKLRSELINQFQPVRMRAAQSNLFRRRTQKYRESVGDYYRSLKELYRRTFPMWARSKDPDGEEVLHTAFMGGIRAKLQLSRTRISLLMLSIWKLLITEETRKLRRVEATATSQRVTDTCMVDLQRSTTRHVKTKQPNPRLALTAESQVTLQGSASRKQLTLTSSEEQLS